MRDESKQLSYAVHDRRMSDTPPPTFDEAAGFALMDANARYA